jgi:acetyltransferase-like isoleucine patch superfamily enzyme
VHDVPLGVAVAGNPARVVTQVDEVTEHRRVPERYHPPTPG